MIYNESDFFQVFWRVFEIGVLILAKPPNQSHLGLVWTHPGGKGRQRAEVAEAYTPEIFQFSYHFMIYVKDPNTTVMISMKINQGKNSKKKDPLTKKKIIGNKYNTTLKKGHFILHFYFYS